MHRKFFVFYATNPSHRTFEEVAMVAYALMDGIFEFGTEPKE
jgi:hypothetical protein